MICLRIYCFVMLSAMGYGCNSYWSTNFTTKAFIRVETGYHFTYGKKDILNMNIILKNIPHNVSKCHVNYYRADLTPSQTSIEKCDRKKGNEIKIKKHFPYGIVVIYIELCNSNRICYTEKIAEGKQINLDYNNGVQDCLKNDPCHMEVDFKNKYQVEEASIGDQPNGAKFARNLGSSESRRLADRVNAGVPSRGNKGIMRTDCYPFHAEEYFCSSTLFNLPASVSIYQWYQVFNNSSYIGAIPPIRGTITNFHIKLEKFDNNTEVFSTVNAEYVDETTKKNKITFIDIGVNTSSKYVQFTCQNYRNQTTHTQVGLIDKTENNITTLNTTILERKFTMIDNGTILCCINYLVKTVTDDTQIIKRLVEKKTLLIYDETSSFDDMDWSHGSSYYIIVTVLIVFVLLITIILLKKCCCVKKQPQTRLNPTEPFYLNMLFRKECQQEIEAQEHYEEIH